MTKKGQVWDSKSVDNAPVLDLNHGYIGSYFVTSHETQPLCFIYIKPKY